MSDGKPDQEVGPLPDPCPPSALSCRRVEGGGPIRQMTIMRLELVCNRRRGSNQRNTVFGWARPEPERLTREVLSVRHALVQRHPNLDRTGVAPSTSPDAEPTSVPAGQRLYGAPRRNRAGDPILTIDARVVHVTAQHFT
jgi:hypothetical protein